MEQVERIQRDAWDEGPVTQERLQVRTAARVRAGLVSVFVCAALVGTPISTRPPALSLRSQLTTQSVGYQTDSALGLGPEHPRARTTCEKSRSCSSCRFKVQIADSGHPRHNLLRRRRSEKRNRHPTRPLEASCGFVPGRCSTLDGDTGRWPPPARIACAAKAIRSVASGRGQRFHHRVARHATGPRESSTYGPIVSTLGHSPAPRRAAGRLNRLGEARRALQPSAPAPHGRLVSGAAI